MILNLLDEAFWKKTWHGPNLRQSLRGLRANQAAWRPGRGCHNIWELTLHAAYWKYAVRRKLQGGKRGSFALTGSNFFSRPGKGKVTETAWRKDLALLEEEHRQLEKCVQVVVRSGKERQYLRILYGVAFHDIYHAGQIRLLRRLMK